MENLSIASEGHRLHAVLHEAVNSAPCAVILCPGAFEESGHWSDYAQRLAAQETTAMVLDFVGRGQQRAACLC